MTRLLHNTVEAYNWFTRDSPQKVPLAIRKAPDWHFDPPLTRPMQNHFVCVFSLCPVLSPFLNVMTPGGCPCTVSNRWGLLDEIMTTMFDEGMDVSRDQFFEILDGMEFL